MNGSNSLHFMNEVEILEYRLLPLRPFREETYYNYLNDNNE